MYRAIGLLQPANDFDIPAAKKRLAGRLTGHTVTLTGETIVAALGEWWIAVAQVSGAGIREEIEGLVGNLAGIEPDEASAFAASEKRVEVWTDVPDPFMEHFNDFLVVVEVLKSFQGMMVVDPHEPGVL